MSRTRVIGPPPLLAGQELPLVWIQWFARVKDYLAQVLPAVDDTLVAYETIELPLVAAMVDGANPPSVATFAGTTKARSFSATSMNEIFFGLSIPNGYAPGLPVVPFLRWAPGTGALSGVIWGMELSVSGGEGKTFGLGSPETVVSAPGGVALGHEVAVFQPVQGAGLVEGATVVGRLWRDGGTDVSADPAFGLAVGLQYPKRKIGKGRGL